MLLPRAAMRISLSGTRAGRVLLSGTTFRHGVRLLATEVAPARTGRAKISSLLGASAAGGVTYCLWPARARALEDGEVHVQDSSSASSSSSLVERKGDRERPHVLVCASRLLTLLLCGLPVMALLPICKLLDSSWLWEVYRSVCISAIRRYGATAVKLGQWAASRKDLFGDEITKLLPDELHNNVEGSTATPAELQRVREVCARSGAKLMDSEPLEEIGSGCVANVFKARKEDGTDVIVKILRKGTRERMLADMTVMQWLVQIAHRLKPELEVLALDEALMEFSGYMQVQTDFTIEATNLNLMRKNFENSAYVRLPDVHGSPTSEVLVQSYVDGHNLSDLLKPDVKDDLLRDPLTRKLVSLELGRAFCKMLFVDNLTHLDLHPGNIKVRFIGDPRERRFSLIPDWLWDKMPSVTSGGLCDPEDTSPRWKVPLPVLGLLDVIESRWAQVTGSAAFELVLLDTGMTLSMSVAKMEHIRTTCGAAVQGNVEGAGRGLLDAHLKFKRCRSNAQDVLDRFVQDMGALLVGAVRWSQDWQRFFADYDSYANAGTAEFLSIACRIFGSAKIRMDPEIYCATAAIALVEGSMRSCFQECCIARCALPFLLPKFEFLHRISSG